MEAGLIPFVWRHSRAQQLAILATTVATLPLLYLSLELPKIIVNEAIEGDPSAFPREIYGESVDRLPFLVGLCVAFLATVLAINALKYVMNVSIGMCGERMLRRIRYSLVDHAMRFPPQRFRTSDPGEVVQTVIAETEPLGGFIGELISTPAYQGGMFVVFVGFIFAQNPLLGLAAVATIPLQAVVIPRMQRRVVRLNRERAANQRRVAEAISEPVTGFDEVVTNGAALWRLSRLSARLHVNTMLRLAIYRRKYVIKALSNVLNQVTPFFFYSVGGWLVITGRLEIGALVAVLAAYKDIAKPWRELLNYYQRFSDFRGRFDFVVASFTGEDLMPPERLTGPAEGAAPLGGKLRFEGVEGGSGASGLSIPELEIEEGAEVALVGGGEAARAALMRLAAGLESPGRGSVTLGGREIARATLPEIGAGIGYLASEPGVLRGSIRENLFYGLYRSPPALHPDRQRDAWREAKATGAPGHHAAGDWLDYKAAGARGALDLEARMLRLVEAAGLAPELLDAAFDARLDPDEAKAWEERMGAARSSLAAALAEADLADAVAPWDRDAFNEDASLLENILFAAPSERGADAPATAAVLARSGGDRILAEAGWALASEFASVIETVGRDSGVLDNLGGIPRSEILAANDLFETNRDRGLDGASRSTRKALIALGASFTPARDRFEIVDPPFIARVMEARRAAAPALAGRGGFTPFDSGAVAPGLTIAQNMLGGPRRHARRSAWRRLDALMRDAAAAADLTEPLLELGLETPTAPGAPLDLRRRIALLRILLKRPRLVILAVDDADMAAMVRRETQGATVLRLADETTAADAGIVVRLTAEGALDAVERPDVQGSEDARAEERVK